jgi:hypothetical protein
MAQCTNLTPYDGIKAAILKRLRSKDYLITMNKDNPQVSEPFKVNVKRDSWKNSIQTMM